MEHDNEKHNEAPKTFQPPTEHIRCSGEDTGVSEEAKVAEATEVPGVSSVLSAPLQYPIAVSLSTDRTKEWFAAIFLPATLPGSGYQGKPEMSNGFASGEGAREGEPLTYESRTWPVRVAEVRGLERLGEGQEQVEGLLAALQDEHEAVRAAAARALGKLGERLSLAPIAALAGTLRDPSWQVRTAGVMALGKLGERAPVALLLTSLHDEDMSVRAAAAWAIGKQGKQTRIAPLVNALSDASWIVREAAALALEELAGAGQHIPVEPLLNAMMDEESSVRQVAERALQLAHAEELKTLAIIDDMDALAAARELDELRSLPLRNGTSHDVVEPGNEKNDGQEPGSKGKEDEVSVKSAKDTGDERPAETVQQLRTELHRGTRPLHGGSAGRHSAHASARRHSRTRPRLGRTRRHPLVRTLETGMAAAVLLGLLLSSWLLFTYLHTQTGAQGTKFPLTVNSHVSIRVIQWSPDNTRLALAGADGSLQVLDVRTRQLSRASGKFDSILTVLWTDRGLSVATESSAGTVVVNELSNKLDPLDSFAIPVAGPAVAAFSFDGRLITVGDQRGTVRIWDIVGKRALKVFATHAGRQEPDPGTITAIAWTHDDKGVTTASDNGQRSNNITIQRWNAESGIKVGSNITSVSNRVIALKWSPDDTLLAHATVDGGVGIWNAGVPRDIILNANAYTSSNPESIVPTLAWSPHTTRLAASVGAGGNGKVEVWDTGKDAGATVASYAVYAQVNDLAWSPGGQYLAWGDVDGLIQVQQIQA